MTPVDRVFRQLSARLPRSPRNADALLVVVVFLVTVFVSFDGPNQSVAIRLVGDVPVAAFPILAVASGALYWRKSRPLVALGVTLAASAMSLVLDYSDLVGVAMIVALYSAGRYVTNDRWSYVGLWGAFTLVGLSAFVAAVSAAEIGFGLLLMFVIWYSGRRGLFQGQRAAQLEREHAAEARRVVAEERTRIARELHDVVAHRVSLMTVQAGAARTIAGDDLEGAVRAMEAVEQAGRQALDELRHLLGVLRPEGEADGLGPQPRLSDVPRLVGQFEEAGLDVSLTMNGARSGLPAPVDLSAYRIVEEALTNVLKHAGLAARTEVRISSDNNEVLVEVLDRGLGVTILPGSGHGIVGMRERTLLLGGKIETGPRPGGGFQVVAHLPVEGDPA